MLITNNFPYRKQILKLWLTHNSGGRTQFAPTETAAKFALKFKISKKNAKKNKKIEKKY